MVEVPVCVFEELAPYRFYEVVVVVSVGVSQETLRGGLTSVMPKVSVGERQENPTGMVDFARG